MSSIGVTLIELTQMLHLTNALAGKLLVPNANPATDSVRLSWMAARLEGVGYSGLRHVTIAVQKQI
jgi:hypothetical protein